jgi:hypothetical protein
VRSSWKDPARCHCPDPHSKAGTPPSNEAHGEPNVALGSLVVSVPLGVIAAVMLLSWGIRPATALSIGWAIQMIGFCVCVALGLQMQDLRANRGSDAERVSGAIGPSAKPPGLVESNGMARRAQESAGPRPRA